MSIGEIWKSDKYIFTPTKLFCKDFFSNKPSALDYVIDISPAFTYQTVKIGFIIKKFIKIKSLSKSEKPDYISINSFKGIATQNRLMLPMRAFIFLF